MSIHTTFCVFDFFVFKIWESQKALMFLLYDN